MADDDGDPGSQGRPVALAVGALVLGLWIMWMLQPMDIATAICAAVLLVLVGVVVVGARRNPPSALPPSPIVGDAGKDVAGSVRWDLVREPGRTLAGFPLLVVVDGHEVARVANGTTSSITVRPGARHVRAHCTSTATEVLVLECAEGSRYEITFTASGTMEASVKAWLPLTSAAWGVSSTQLDPDGS